MSAARFSDAQRLISTLIENNLAINKIFERVNQREPDDPGPLATIRQREKYAELKAEWDCVALLRIEGERLNWEQVRTTEQVITVGTCENSGAIPIRS